MSKATLQLWHDGLVAADEIVAKTLAVSPVSMVARVEVRARRLLANRWDNKVRQFVKVAAPMLLGKATLNQVMTKADSIFGDWAKEVTPSYLKEIERAYRFARIAAWDKVTKRTTASLQYDLPALAELKTAKATAAPVAPKLEYATLTPSFDLADDAAIAAIQQKEVFWIGKHYKSKVQQSIRGTAKQVIATGRGETWGAKELQKTLAHAANKVQVPAGFTGTSRQYFEGVTANAVTAARVQGQMRSFVDLGVSRYEIVNPADERTCEQCSHMNGKIFTIEHGTKVMGAETAATTPDQVKAAHPWISTGEMKAISPKPGPVGMKDAGKLSDAGQSLPPFHFKCFLDGTLVWTRMGKKPIEDVKIGDEVLTHKLRWRRVTATMHNFYQGEMLRVRGIGATSDHPYLLFREKSSIFDAVASGDLVAKVTTSLDNVRCLPKAFSSCAFRFENSPVMFAGVHASKSSKSGKIESPEASAKRICRAIKTGQISLRTMQKSGRTHPMPSKKVSILFGGLQKQGDDSRQKHSVSGMRQRLLAISKYVPGCQDLFFCLPTKEVGAVRLWSERRPWQTGDIRDSVARQNSGAQLLGRSSCDSIVRDERKIPLRAQEIHTSRGIDLSARFLPTTAGYLDRSERMVEARTPRDCAFIPAAFGMDWSTQIQKIEFVPVGVIERWEATNWVRNLTVEEDESFVVGEEGLIVHNCRCTADVSQEAGSFTPIPATDLGKPIKFAGVPVPLGGALKPKPIVARMTPINKTAKQLIASEKTATAMITEAESVNTANFAKKMQGNVTFEKMVARVTNRTYEAFLKLDKAERLRLSQFEIQRLVLAWTHSSAGSNPISVALQVAARDEFGLKKAAFGHINKKLAAVALKDKITHEGFKSILRAMYNDTQALLAKQGKKTLIVYRGMQFKDVRFLPSSATAKGKLIIDRLKTQPLSSYSVEAQRAAGFTGSSNSVVAAAEVPAERVLSFHGTGLGTSKELEIVVLGGEDKMTTYVWKRSAPAWRGIVEAPHAKLAGEVK